MIDVTYETLRVEDENTWTVTRVVKEGQPYYVAPHYFFLLAALNRQHMRLSGMQDTLAAGRPFIFPLEMRWDFVSHFAKDGAPLFLTPYVPEAVLEAARQGRAIILTFYGHEAMPMHYTNPQTGKKVSTYDLLLDFIKRHALPAQSVWLMSGDLRMTDDFKAWKEQNSFGGKPDPFQARSVSIYLYALKAMRQLREDGMDFTEEWEVDANNIETFKRWKRRPVNFALNEVYASADTGSTETPTKLFLCMNRFPRLHRCFVAAFLNTCGLIERSLVSFRDDGSKIDLGNEVLQKGWEDLKKKMPLNIDSDLGLDAATVAKTNLFVTFVGTAWPYQKTFFSIVPETMFDDYSLFITEKTWKPVMNGHPFIVVGSAGTLAYLRSLGFKTFHPVINERYDTIANPSQRMMAIFNSIKQLGDLLPEQLIELRQTLRPIVEHNMQLIKTMVTPMEKIMEEMAATLDAATDKPSFGGAEHSRLSR